MISRNLLFHFQYCMLCLLSFHTRRTSPVNFLSSYCANTTYEPNSISGRIYSNNLYSVLDALSSNAFRTDTGGFYNISTGNDPSNTVYGLFLCRGDVSTDVCGQCVAIAAVKVIEECPYHEDAIVWYEECFLRFSNQAIFSRVDSYVVLSMYNVQNVTGRDQEKFKTTLENLVNDIAVQAANRTGGKMFAVREGDYSMEWEVE
ncbi:cysteine-rich receptor-like protein kinase 25 [Coffea eugenioides]|uniref:cysteine-rich receptor-like protein kinase 25 n=1 Tax=Coffea eugenioides TaxID=49369 RepID=UPI000F60D69E|nr:cysteine-rich receptor-like protein kinase 25 [Coffea eugenioides]